MSLEQRSGRVVATGENPIVGDSIFRELPLPRQMLGDFDESTPDTLRSGYPTAGDANIALPDPGFVRAIIRKRQLRDQYLSLDSKLFSDPAWDMLLDLVAAQAEGRRISVTSLCIASGVPLTTALRWIRLMMEADLVERVEDTCDRRRAFIALTDRSVDGIARYFNDVKYLLC